jgi:uncharacterized protein DUF29
MPVGDVPTEAQMPEGLRIIERDEDPYAWALAQAALLRRGVAWLNSVDASGLSDFLEEWADEMLSAVRSQLVNLMAHAAKAATSRNPEIVGHWRSECIEFHDRLVDAYRPSMHAKIDLASSWRRATRKVNASFADHGEPQPKLPDRCPFTLDQLVDPDLDLEQLFATITGRAPEAARRRRAPLRPQPR